MTTIIIHALGATMGGAKRHITNFVPALIEADQKVKYIILVRKDCNVDKSSPNVEMRQFPDSQYSSFLKRVWFDNVKLLFIVKNERADLLVSLTNFGPVKVPCRHIIFQRNPIYYSSYYLKRIPVFKLVETLLRRYLTFLIMKNAQRIITPSKSMAQMIREKYPRLAIEKFTVIYHGFTADTITDTVYNWEAKIDTVRYKLLYSSHPGVHKGYDILFIMIHELVKLRKDFVVYLTMSRSKDSHRVIEQYEKIIEQLGITDQVVFLGQIPQREMRRLYEKCDVMVYPSLAESFGFSMVEAMGYGLPVIASDTSVNKEICGNGAVYYSSLNASDGANVINSILNRQKLDECVQKVKKQFKTFDWSWKRYSREFVAMVNEVAIKEKNAVSGGPR